MTIQIFLGTKAQYIKTAPLLRLLEERGVVYRLIDSGQHAALSMTMRADLGVRPPDRVLGGDHDIESIPQAIAWAAGLAGRLVSRRAASDIFAGAQGGVCVVHGDTPSTLLATLLARRAGLRVAHLEAGLRSHSLIHPFPEELIRVGVMRLSDILFAPDARAVENLEAMRLGKRIVPLPANTSVESLAYALGEDPGQPGEGPAIVTMHRVENLQVAARVRGIVRVAAALARQRPVRFVVHGPTRPVLVRHGLLRTMERSGMEIVGLRPHDEFVRMLHDASVVVTDGGSIQEECALLGVPTLLWRRRTERPDGLGENVVLSRYDPQVVARFLRDPERHRRPIADLSARPSETIFKVLEDVVA